MEENIIKGSFPKIRFKGFTDAWEQQRLGDLSTFRRGSFPQPYGLKKWYGGENAKPFVQVVDIGEDFRLNNLTKQTISKIAQPFSVFVPKGSVVVTLQGSIGRVALTQYSAYFDRTILIFDKYKTIMDKYFFAYLVHNKFEIEKQKAPGGTIKTITKEALSDFELLYPNHEEQIKIARIFYHLDSLLTLRQRELDKLKQIKKGLLQKMFPSEGEDQPKIRFKGFTDAWEQHAFKEIFDYERPDKYIVTSDEYEDDAKTPVLTANKGFILGYTSETRTYNKPCVIFDDFTLDSKYVNFDFMVKSSALKILTTKNNYDLYFSYELLKNANIENLGHKRHYISVVQDTEVFCPSSDKQKKISDLFQSFESILTLRQRELDKLKQIKKGLLQKMFA